MRTRTQRQFVTDIVEAMSLAEQFVAGMSLEALEEDIKTQKDLPSEEST